MSKGNHDFLTTNTWTEMWGYPTNHVVDYGDYAFVLADTTSKANHEDYMSADAVWLKTQMDLLASKRAVSICMHIAQRAEGVDGWPQYGVGCRRAREARR